MVISCLMHTMASIALEINVGFLPIILHMPSASSAILLCPQLSRPLLSFLNAPNSLFPLPGLFSSLPFSGLVPSHFFGLNSNYLFRTFRDNLSNEYLPTSHPASLYSITQFVSWTVHHNQNFFSVCFVTSSLTVSTTRMWTPWGRGSWSLGHHYISNILKTVWHTIGNQ